MKKIYSFLFATLLATVAFSQDELVLNGGDASVTIQSGGLLYVKGEVKMIGASKIENNGEVEINTNNNDIIGDPTNPSLYVGGILQLNDDFDYTGTGTVRFTGNNDAVVRTNNIGSHNTVTFKNLEIEIEGTVTGPTGASITEYGDLFSEMNIVVSENLVLENGRIFLLDDANFIHVDNPNINAIVAPSEPFGTDASRYVIGTLKRTMTSGSDYLFPVGSMPIDEDPSIRGFQSGREYNPVVLNLNAAATIGVKFTDYGTTVNPSVPFFSPFSSFHPDGCPGVAPWGQWLEFDQMLPDFGVWEVVPDGTPSVSNYTFKGYPNPRHQFGMAPYAMMKVVKMPDTATFADDWSAGVDATGPGNRCDIFAPTQLADDEFTTPVPDVKNHFFANNITTGFSRFGVAVGSSTGLPVELLTLRADPVNNEFIKVSWATASEINNSGFEVLRSIDGVNFDYIGWVTGVGNSSSTNNYFLDDHDVVANQLYYYRLRQIDFDGTSELTYIVSAMITNTEVFTVSEFMPNPAENNTSLIITSGTDRDVNITFFNTLGQIITNNNYVVNKGTNRIDIDLSHFAAATYYGSITSDDFVLSKKIIVTR